MKTSVSQRAPRLVALLALALATLSASNLSAQNATVTTVPVGAVTVTINPAVGAARRLTTLSFPLSDDSVISGQQRGQITSITATTITNSNAGWTAGQLSTSAAAAPNLIQMTSGAEIGRTFLISVTAANTATTLTIDSVESGLVNLTTTGIVAGDTYRIIACDTLASIFGGPQQSGIIANADGALADQVKVLVGTAYRTYHHNGTNWVRLGVGTVSNNIAIRPDSMVLFSRVSTTAMSLTFVGTVPSVNRKAIVRNAGLSTLSTSWPMTRTLGDTNLQNLSGWVNSNAAGTTTSATDVVQVLVGSAYRTYCYNGTQWVRANVGTASNSVSIPAGSGVIVNKKSGSSGTSLAVAQTIPYTL